VVPLLLVAFSGARAGEPEAAPDPPEAPGPGRALIVTVAGGGDVGDGGPAAEARLSLPGGIVVEPDGSLVVVDFGNHRVRRVDARTGIIRTIAGTGEPGFSGDDGPASEAQIARPEYAVVGPDDALYIVDSHNHRIRRIDRETGIITTVAGTGERGFGGDGGPATEALLNQPEGIAFGPDGEFYVGDTLNGRIRRVDAETGVITTFAGNGRVGLTPDGVRSEDIRFMRLARLDTDREGNVYVADSPSHKLHVVDAETGRLRTLAGTGISGYSGDGGPATRARVSYPEGVIVGPEGNVFFADLGNHVVRRVDAETGVITTIAGTGVKGYSGDGGPATEAQLWGPGRLDLGADGDLYIADIINARIRKIDARTGTISTVIGSGGLGDGGPAREALLAIPADLVYTHGFLYINEIGNRRVRRYDPDTGRIETVAGGGALPDGGGRATEIELKLPEGIAIDGDGRLYVADSLTHKIWRVDLDSGRLEHFAGTGERGFSGDGGPATEARLHMPGSLAVGSDDALYVADYGNRCIRRIDLSSGSISTVPVRPRTLFSLPVISLVTGEDTLYWVAAGDAALYRMDLESRAGERIPIDLPCCLGDTDEFQFGDLTLAGDGDLYLADTLAHRVLRLDPETGDVTVVAGAHDRPGFAGDGGAPRDASLFRPGALVTGEPGELYVADSFNHRVRVIRREGAE
jgi:sugar lactone lactonase YvrE